MARYQSLPDRIDTIGATVSDQTMCLNYGNVLDCCITFANTKCTMYLMGSSTSCIWCVPAGVCSFVVELWGAGGGGGGGGNGTACTAGGGGGAGGYASATIPTSPGSKYVLCVGPVGDFGNCATRGTNGSPAYITGPNAGNLCVTGGYGGCTMCQSCGANGGTINGFGYPPGDTVATSPLVAVGSGPSGTGANQCCAYLSRGGSAPFGGGAGAFHTLNLGGSGGIGGHFPGGGGGGACVTTGQSCGGCGGGGLIKIWY